jgi:prepilin-type N-terminal cleavage/methylation domain-containing protein
MKNNKGFSLVELIIVIAIMAVLIGVLAPQYLRYVEKSKKQADLSAVGQVFDAVKVALSDPELQSKIEAGTVVINNGGNGGYVASIGNDVNTDLYKTVPSATIKLTSNTYGSSTFTISVHQGADKEWVADKVEQYWKDAE